MLTLVSNHELPPLSRSREEDAQRYGDEAIEVARELLRALGVEEAAHELTFAGPQIVWSRSARRWRRAGWRPQNHRSSPYSIQ